MVWLAVVVGDELGYRAAKTPLSYGVSLLSRDDGGDCLLPGATGIFGNAILLRDGDVFDAPTYLAVRVLGTWWKFGFGWSAPFCSPSQASALSLRHQIVFG
jgi:hypothetical protein